MQPKAVSRMAPCPAYGCGGSVRSRSSGHRVVAYLAPGNCLIGMIQTARLRCLRGCRHGMEVHMVDEVRIMPPVRVRGRPFRKGQSGNPAGRRFGSRKRATLAAQKLLAGEAEALTRKAVEAALAGNPTAMRLCLRRILPRERAVEFALPPIKSAADIAQTMGAVTAALAEGLITPGEAQAVARVVTIFVQTIETSDFDQRLQILEARQAQPPSSPATVWPHSGVST